MKWLGIIGDLAFNLLFAALALAVVQRQSWTPFRVAADQIKEVRVTVGQDSTWVNKGGRRLPFRAADVRGAYVVIRVHDFPGALEALVRVRNAIARAGAKAFREEVVR